MARPITLFTGQWADLPLETLAQKVSSWGYDGLELACWGDHFSPSKALEDENYVAGEARAFGKARSECMGHRQPPDRPVGSRPQRP